jgi:hypothetical protein
MLLGSFSAAVTIRLRVVIGCSAFPNHKQIFAAFSESKNVINS